MSMRIGNLHPAPGASRAGKRRGKGAASGVGGTSGRGHKGHKARTGGRIARWFEGGQMPLARRLPKRGFKNPGRISYEVVNLGRLAGFAAGTTVDREALWKAGLVSRRGTRVKLLAAGELKAALTVKVDAASEAAKKAVEAVGGRVEIPASS
jgi:large subunit ribosomal protein L15